MRAGRHFWKMLSEEWFSARRPGPFGPATLRGPGAAGAWGQGERWAGDVASTWHGTRAHKYRYDEDAAAANLHGEKCLVPTLPAHRRHKRAAPLATPCAPSGFHFMQLSLATLTNGDYDASSSFYKGRLP